MAKAIVPHVPEPKPRKDNDGTMLLGQLDAGKAISKPDEAATQFTSLVERRANALRLIGGCTLKTIACGKYERTSLSTPLAQPTPTLPE